MSDYISVPRIGCGDCFFRNGDTSDHSCKHDAATHGVKCKPGHIVVESTPKNIAIAARIRLGVVPDEE